MALSRGSVGMKTSGTLYRSMRLVAHLVNRAYWRVEVSGSEEVPFSGAVILAPVHRSFMDFFVVSEVTGRKIFYMAKDDLWSSPRLGRFLVSMGAFPVNRDGTDRVAVDRAQEVLERGDVLVLFPEGTRRVGDVVEDLHEGAAFLSARTGAPVVPIAISGTDRSMPKGSHLPRPVKVRVLVGKALQAPARTKGGRVPRHEVHAMTLRLRDELQQLYEEVRRPG